MVVLLLSQRVLTWLTKLVIGQRLKAFTIKIKVKEILIGWRSLKKKFVNNTLRFSFENMFLRDDKEAINLLEYWYILKSKHMSLKSSLVFKNPLSVILHRKVLI